jgi:hypothetical protein
LHQGSIGRPKCEVAMPLSSCVKLPCLSSFQAYVSSSRRPIENFSIACTSIEEILVCKTSSFHSPVRGFNGSCTKVAREPGLLTIGFIHGLVGTHNSSYTPVLPPSPICFLNPAIWASRPHNIALKYEKNSFYFMVT